MRSLFHNFRLILEHNTDALELMAGLEAPWAASTSSTAPS
jgi:hypothetical protein